MRYRYQAAQSQNEEPQVQWTVLNVLPTSNDNVTGMIKSFFGTSQELQRVYQVAQTCPDTIQLRNCIKAKYAPADTAASCNFDVQSQLAY